MRRPALLGLVWLVTAAGCGGSGPTPERLALKRPPYAGIACPGQPNPIDCNRVGLAVWLRRPAIRLTATIAGRRVQMRSPGHFVAGKGTGWEGYLHLAGLKRGPLDVSEPPVIVPVHITAHYTTGPPRARTIRLELHPGWG